MDHPLREYLAETSNIRTTRVSMPPRRQGRVRQVQYADYSDDSSDEEEEEEILPNNLDPTVAALLEKIGKDEATQSLLRTRIAMMKLQQARIRGNSDYAAKIMDHAIEEGSRDREAWTLLEKHMKKLETQVGELDRKEAEQKKEDEKKKQEEEEKANENAKTEGDDNQQDNENKEEGKEDEEDEVTSEKVKQLKDDLAKEQERGNALEELLVHCLEEEIGSVVAEQQSLKEREERIKARVRSLEDALKKLQCSDETKLKELQNQMKEVQENQCTLVNAMCAVCHEQSATKAVIPCGHLCLCDACTKSITQLDSAQRACPLCRGNLLSTLHIYTSK